MALAFEHQYPGRRVGIGIAPDHIEDAAQVPLRRHRRRQGVEAGGSQAGGQLPVQFAHPPGQHPLQGV